MESILFKLNYHLFAMSYKVADLVFVLKISIHSNVNHNDLEY